MGDLPERQVGDSGHLFDHDALREFFNNFTLGPFELNWDTPNIDTGVTLFTPNVGDRIVGLHVEFTEQWDSPVDYIGLGVAGTADADLGFRIPLLEATLPSYPTWVRGIGIGFGLGAEVARLLTTAPIKARTVTGGHSVGGLNLWVSVLPATLFD